MKEISDILKAQDSFFKSGSTRSLEFRIESLYKLKKAIIESESKIFDALKKDLGKSSAESYMTEVGYVLDEIKYTIKNLKKWVEPKRVKASLSQMPGRGYVYSEGYGKVLIMSPWNYPFQLAIAPLIGSIAGGNCTIIKPSAYSLYTSNVIKDIIENVFKSEYIAVLQGGRDINEKVLNERFDYIFFTGSVSVGKLVMEKASKNLTPITLELGGKSPCIVDKDCDISKSAKKLAWGKFLNSGQTCVAPDYVLVEKSIKNKFIHEVRKYVKEFYGENPIKSQDYSNIINIKHFNRLKSYIKDGDLIFGGDFDEENKKISPTLIENIKKDSSLMNDEIFGPILPIIEYENLDLAIDFINSKPKPLALYLFTNDKSVEEKVLSEVSFGGGCINDVILHLATSYMGFGGVGDSGMGCYHGKESFDTFTHKKSILKKSNIFDISLRYPPYKGKLEKIKKILK